MLLFSILILCLTHVECKKFDAKSECLNHVSSILGDTFNSDLCVYVNLKWTTDVDQKQNSINLLTFGKLKNQLFRNEEGNYYKDESECLNAMLPSVFDGQTPLYCEACDTACQSCPRKGQWIKFNAIAYPKDCYCDMTTCDFRMSAPGGVGTVRCSGNAIMDGRGNCVNVIEIETNHDENLEDLFRSDHGRSSESIDEANVIQQSASDTRSGSSTKIILLFLLALCF